MFQYWTQHCYPADCVPHAQRVDQGVLAAVTMVLGNNLLDDDIAMQRLRLPARKFGGGIRSLADVAPAAFVGTLCKAAPLFADRRDGDWNLVPGFLPMLAAWFPADAFLSTSGDRPFARLLASESRLGQALSVAWRHMQLEVGLDVSGPLCQAAASAGVGDDNCNVRSLSSVSRPVFSGSMLLFVGSLQATSGGLHG